MKAIFLDRDGVLNKNREDYVKTVSELEIFPYIGKAIRSLKNNGFNVIVISNQSAINRGLTTRQNILEIQLKIQDFLKKYDAPIDAFYYCPHRPDENCSCRKPKAGLILQAKVDHEINLEKSWMLGDKDLDIEAGKNAGCRTMKIDEKFNLTHAVEKILND